MTSMSERYENKWIKNAFGEDVALRGGKFSKEESEKIRAAAVSACAAKQIDPSRLCAECEHKPELRGIWLEIAQEFPHRSVQSVYRHGIRLLHPFKRGPWSPGELVRLLWMDPFFLNPRPK